MSLSVIIVNYRSADLIIDALRSFVPDKGMPMELIIVDNNSGDQSLERISAVFSEVKSIQMDYNAGFARANNKGIRQSGGEVVLLLNPDTLCPGHAIENCYRHFVGSDYVACGVQLQNADGSPQISGNYFMKGGLNNLLPLPITGKLIKWLGEKLKVKKPNVPDSDSMVEVDWINGAFLMVKRSAIETAGLLDEDFFLYAEEIEWCARLRKSGQLAVFGDIKVKHLQGETANVAFGSEGKGYYNLYDRKGLQILVSNFLRIRKQFGIAWFLFHLSVYLVEIPLLGIAWLLNKIAGRNRITLRMLTGYFKNMINLLGLSPRIISNKPYFYKVL